MARRHPQERQVIELGQDLGRRLARGGPLAAGDVQAESPSSPRTASLIAPQVVVVTPLECQSNPSTQPNAWNQNGFERRPSTSPAP
jgi:hypothetical protein